VIPSIPEDVAAELARVRRMLVNEPETLERLRRMLADKAPAAVERVRATRRLSRKPLGGDGKAVTA